MASTVTLDGLTILLSRGYDSTTAITVPSQFKVGIDQTSAVSTDTDLDHPVPISGTEQVDDCEVTTGWTDSADLTLSVNSTTFKQGVASLNLTKDGTGSASASTSKTTTSRDITSKELSIWIFVLDSAALAKMATTAAFSIQLGSDSSNYHQWDKDAADFSVGWNLVDGLTVATASSTTGSPVITAMDFTLVQLTATGSGITWSAADFIMDDIKIVSADDFFKDFTSGYPIIDTVSKQVEIRCDLSSLEANGHLLGGFGQFNSDGTPLMESLDDFTAESKTLTDEIIFTTKTRMQIGTVT